MRCWRAAQQRQVHRSLHVCFRSTFILDSACLRVYTRYLQTSFADCNKFTLSRLATDIPLVSIKVLFFNSWCLFALTDGQQFISQSPTVFVLAVTSKLPTVLPTMQVLPSVQVVSQIKSPSSSCDLPHLIPTDTVAECALCKDGQLMTVARSSSSSNIAVYYRVVFHGSSCGPWLLVSPPTVAPLADRTIRSENVLRIVSAEHAALLLLPSSGPVQSSVLADRRSSKSEQALHLRSLAASAAVFANYPAASSFFISYKPLLTNVVETLSPQALRSHIIVHTRRPLLLPRTVSWRLSSDVVVVTESKPPVTS